MLSSYPGALKKKVMLLLAGSVASLIAFITISIIFKNLYLSIPFAVVFGIFGFSAYNIMRYYNKGKIVVVEGNCEEIVKSFAKTRISTLIIQTEDKRLQVKPKEKYRHFSKGDHVILYIKDDMDVYKEGDVYVLNDYIAIQIAASEESVPPEKTSFSSFIGGMINKN